MTTGEFRSGIEWNSLNGITKKRISKIGVSKAEEPILNNISMEKSEKLGLGVEEKSFAVKLVNLTAKWDEKDEENTLEKVDAVIEKGKVYTVIGAVGAGKSSLISAILGEMAISEGYIDVNGSVSYASQEAWIFGKLITLFLD